MLEPINYVVSAVLATAYRLLTGLGMPSGSGLTWVLSITLLVCVVRAVLLPITVHSVKMAHASARARPALQALQEKYKGVQDRDQMMEMLQEQKAIKSEHGVSSAGCLPVLLQMPIFFSLYRVLLNVASGQTTGMMTTDLVASMREASLFGVTLADKMGPVSALTTNPGHFLVILGLAVCSAVFSYITQAKFAMENMSLEGMPEAFVKTQQIMPIYMAIMMLLVSVAVPVGLLIYWVSSNLWTLVQTAVITLFFPTPGTPAYYSYCDRRGITPIDLSTPAATPEGEGESEKATSAAASETVQGEVVPNNPGNDESEQDDSPAPKQ